jgi:hypothetical protein
LTLSFSGYIFYSEHGTVLLLKVSCKLLQGYHEAVPL